MTAKAMSESFDATRNEQQTLVDLLRWRADTQPERTVYRFLVDGEDEQQELTYAALDERARAVAAVLQRHTTPGARAVLLHPPGLDFVGALFGCLYAGVLAVPAYPPRRSRVDPRISQIMTDAQATVALTAAQHLATVERFSADGDLPGLCAIASDDIPGEAGCDWKPVEIGGDSLALLQYTSGSTVAPKGVMVSHANMLAHSADMAELMQHTPDMVSVSWLPHFHDMGLVFGVIQPAYAGFVGCLMPPASFLQQPIRWLHTISRFRAAISGAPNFAWDLCVSKISAEQKADLDLSAWRIAFSGAETVRWRTLERFAHAFEPCGFRREALCPAYGLAEATLRVTSAWPHSGPSASVVRTDELRRNRAVEAAHGQAGTQVIVSCGYALPHTRIAIIDPASLQVLGPGKIGEIWVAGPTVARGYWNRPDESLATFEARTADGDGPFLRTGDLGFVKDDQLYVTGRLKDLIIIRGLNHHPQDIERTVETSHPDLRPDGGAAFSVEDADEEALVIIQEIDRQRRNPDVQAVVDRIVEAVTERHGIQPHAVVLIKHGSCPKTTSGKIQRHAARAEFLGDRLRVVGQWRAKKSVTPAATSPAVEREAAQPPSEDAIREWLIAKVADRVGVASSAIDPGRAFVQLGVGSAEALTLIGELELWLGHKLSPVLVYNYPDIDSLARHLAQAAPPEQATSESRG